MGKSGKSQVLQQFAIEIALVNPLRLGFGAVKHEELIGPGVQGRKVRAFHNGLTQRKSRSPYNVGPQRYLSWFISGLTMVYGRYNYN